MVTGQWFSVAAAILFTTLLSYPISTPAATSNPYTAALSLYSAGTYDAAAIAARQIGSAEGHALAARALLAKAATESPFDKRLSLLKEAEAEADAAIAANDRVLEGHLQKLIAFGYMSRMPGFNVGNMTAARISRQLLDRVLRIEPDNPWVLASLGGWNFEISKRASLGLGSIMFGATRTNGFQAFERALALAPDNVVIRYQYGLSLLWLDADAYQSKAETALNAAIALQTDDAYSHFLQSRARRLLSLVSAKDFRGLEMAIAVYRGERAER